MCKFNLRTFIKNKNPNKVSNQKNKQKKTLYC